jgi:GLPGLI family protein
MIRYLLLFFFTCYSNYGQNFEVEYNLSLTDTKDEYGVFGFAKIKLITSASESISYTKNIDTVLVIPNTEITHEQTATNYSPSSYKNVYESTYYSSTLFKNYDLKDSFYSINWDIGKNKKYILGYECQESTGNYRGRDYIAYFTTVIPIQNGPHTFDNLPGLILEIKSTDGYVNYLATSVKSSNEKILNPFIEKKYINWEEFKIMYKKYFNKMINYKPDENTTIYVPNRGVEFFID